MSASLSDNDSLDGRTAVLAGRALFAVDSVAVLKRSFLTGRIDIIRNRRSAGFDGLFENLNDSLVKPAEPFGFEA